MKPILLADEEHALGRAGLHWEGVLSPSCPTAPTETSFKGHEWETS